MTRFGADAVAGILVLAFAMLIFVLTRSMPDGPASFPRLIAVLFAVSGAVLIIKSPKRVAALEKAPAPKSAPGLGLTALVAVIWLVMLYSASHLGFALPGSVFLFVTSWLLMGRPKDVRTLGGILLFSICVTAALVAIFVFALGVEPRGPFGF